MKKEMYQAYSKGLGKTVIFEDVDKGNGHVLTKVRGSYKGEPNEESFQKIINKKRPSYIS